MSVLSSMRYCLGDPYEYSAIWTALAFMPFGLFFDFMDGKIARWRSKSSLMGQELDSLADLVFQPTPIHISESINHLTIYLFIRFPSVSLPPPLHSPSEFAPQSTTSFSRSSSSAVSPV